MLRQVIYVIGIVPTRSLSITNMINGQNRKWKGPSVSSRTYISIISIILLSIWLHISYYTWFNLSLILWTFFLCLGLIQTKFYNLNTFACQNSLMQFIEIIKIYINKKRNFKLLWIIIVAKSFKFLPFFTLITYLIKSACPLTVSLN